MKPFKVETFKVKPSYTNCKIGLKHKIDIKKNCIFKKKFFNTII